MGYDYTKQKAELFTENGLNILLRIRDNVNQLLSVAGAFQAEKAFKGAAGDSWTQLAALDYLVEREEIRRVTPENSTWAQYEVFVSAQHP